MKNVPIITNFALVLTISLTPIANAQQSKPLSGRYALPFPGSPGATAETPIELKVQNEASEQYEMQSAIESMCGALDDSQWVEHYTGEFDDGGFSPTKSFVKDHQSSTGQIQWNSDLAEKYANPGNVAGVRWCSGALIDDDLFLTAGHCFNREGSGWSLPTTEINGIVQVISHAEIARNMHVNFNYQYDGETNVLRDQDEFPIVELLENWKGDLDYAIVRLGKNSDGNTPGSLYGFYTVSTAEVAAEEPITIIQHPMGNPKKVEAGTVEKLSPTRLNYGDLDTFSGASGASVLNRNGEVIGVHIQGGCTQFNTGYNKATKTSAIGQVSEILQ